MPKDLDDAVRIAEGRLPPEEAQELGGKSVMNDFKSAVIDDDSGVPEEKDIPEWVTWPAGLKVRKGKNVVFVRFRASWTDAPHLGDRVVILWPLSVADERLARRRARGDDDENVIELTKQMVRAVDGKVVSWDITAKLDEKTRAKFAEKTGVAIEGVNIERVWDDIGSKGRNVLAGLYMQLHTLRTEELADFFQNCTHASVASG